METSNSEPLSVGTNNSPTILIVDESKLSEQMSNPPSGISELTVVGNNGSQTLPVISGDKLLEQLSSDDGKPLLVGSNNSPTFIVIDDGKVREQLSNAENSDLSFIGTNSTVTFRVVEDEELLDKVSNALADDSKVLAVGNNNSSLDLSNATSDGNQLVSTGNNDTSLAGGQSTAGDANEPKNDDSYNWQSQSGEGSPSDASGSPMTGGDNITGGGSSPIAGGDNLTNGGNSPMSGSSPTTGGDNLTDGGSSPIPADANTNDPDFFRGLFGGGNAPENNESYDWKYDLQQTSGAGGSPAFAGNSNLLEGGSGSGDSMASFGIASTNNTNSSNLPVSGSNNSVEVL